MAKFYFLVILVGLVSCGVFDFNGTFEDYFLYTAQNQLDHSVDPCDDFYRHVCPKTIKTTLVQYSRSIIEYAIKEGREQSKKLPLSEIERLCNVLLRSLLFDKNADVSVEESAYKLSDFFNNLRNTVYMLHFMKDNDIHTTSEYKFLQKFVKQLLSITQKELDISSRNDKYFQETTDIGNILKNMVIHIGLQEEQQFAEGYTLIQNRVDSIFNKHFQLHNISKITELDVVERNEEFSKILSNFIQPILTAMENFDSLLTTHVEVMAVNAFNDDNDLMIREHYLLPATVTSKAAKYGFIGRVLGHEMMHSFFTDYMFERSELVGEKALCTMRHINRVNKAFKVDVGEKRPYHSYMEDTADHEGTKIAYKAFLEEFGDTKAENIAAGVNITNQQMFFYALAAGKCDPNETTVKDNYSPKHIRVNGAVSLVNGFHETFKCKDDDRMKRIANGESCNLLGNLVR